jgi:hypothetical protein
VLYTHRMTIQLEPDAARFVLVRVERAVEFHADFVPSNYVDATFEPLSFLDAGRLH